jgi:hypothetical protein
MRTSIVQSASKCVWFFVLLLTVWSAAAATMGCEPTTPHPGTAAGSASGAGSISGSAANKGISVDAAGETPRTITALEGDAAVERGAPASGMGGTLGCTPTGVAVAVDGGAIGSLTFDSGVGDAGRDGGPASPTVDAGRVDGLSSGVVGGTGGSGGSMGNSVGGTGNNIGSGIGDGSSTGTRDGTGGGAEGGHGSGGSAGVGVAGAGVAGARMSGTGGTDSPGGAGGGVSGGTGGDMTSAPYPSFGDLAIVELLINPAGTDTGREWIEIVNRTTHTIELSGLNISDAANDAAVSFGSGTTPATLLPGGARVVLIQSGDPTKNGGVTIGGATPGGTFGTLVSLNNDADTISICFGPCATGVLIDSVSWDPTLGSGYDGHALVIDDSDRRCPATTPFGDSGSLGTPGIANGPCP